MTQLTQVVVWGAAIVGGIIGGLLAANHLMEHLPLFSWERVFGTLLCAVAIAILWWLSAPDYNPFATELFRPIMVSAAIGSVISMFYKRK